MNRGIYLAFLTFLAWATASYARPLAFSFDDPQGDGDGSIDVIRMVGNFDNETGNYELVLVANPARPFRGAFRVNVNLFDPDTGSLSEESAYLGDTVNDFDLSAPQTLLRLTGVAPSLLHWKAGDRVATSTLPFGNFEGTTFFRTAVVDLGTGGNCHFDNDVQNWVDCHEDRIAYGLSTTVVEGSIEVSPPSLEAPPVPCMEYPSGVGAPFVRIDYVTPPIGNGDRLVVGALSDLTVPNRIPLPNVPGQQFCGKVQVGPDALYSGVYVPSASDRSGSFPDFAGLLVDPQTKQPFPGGQIPINLFPQVYAWRIGAASDCEYSLSPVNQVGPHTMFTGAIGVSTSENCSWSAVTLYSYISLGPGTSGTGPGTVQFTANANVAADARTALISIAGQAATVTQAGTGPLLTASPNSLDFEFQEGEAGRTDRILTLFTNATALPFTLSASGGPWLSVSPVSGSAPASVVVSVDPAGLAPGIYRGNVAIAASASIPAVPVTLTIDASGPPKLTVESSALTFSFVRGSPARSVARRVTNVGGGTLAFQAVASTDRGGGWLRVSPASGDVQLLQSASFGITADPGGLDPGTYTGTVRVTAGNQVVDVPVTMSIRSATRSMFLSQSGLTFVAIERGVQSPAQRVNIQNTGQGLLDWSASASTLSGGDWLSVSPASGTAEAGNGGSSVDVAVRADGLTAGNYYGQVEVTSASADNAPQVITVLLVVLPVGSNPGPLVRPSGLVFVGAAGGLPPAPQIIQIFNFTSHAMRFVTARLTTDGAGWVTTSPTTAVAGAGVPLEMEVSVSSVGLSPGIRRGVLTLLFDDGSVRTLNLLFVLTGGTTPASDSRGAAAVCTPTQLLPLITSLGAGFNVPAGWPNPLEARVVDDCGNPAVDGSVVATFSNGDPPLPLVSLTDGRWTQTWQPRNGAVARLRVTVTAELPGTDLRGTDEVTGGLRPNMDEPVLASGGILNAASYGLGRPVSPGSMISVFGSKLSQGEAQSPQLPLEDELAGTLVTVGGKVAPLIVATEGQVNAVLPYGLAPNTQHQVVLRRGTRYAVPQAITIAPSEPAIFAKDATGRGQGVIIRADGQWAEPATPATGGTVVILYCTGLGEVNPPVAAGVAAPADPLSRVKDEVKVTIGGVDAKVQYAGLVPFFTGFYQVNAVVPAGVAPGDAVPVVLSVGGQPSTPVTMAVR